VSGSSVCLSWPAPASVDTEIAVTPEPEDDHRTKHDLRPRFQGKRRSTIGMAEKACPCCWGELHRIGEDIAERSAAVPAQTLGMVPAPAKVRLPRVRGHGSASARLRARARRRAADRSAGCPGAEPRAATGGTGGIVQDFRRKDDGPRTRSGLRAYEDGSALVVRARRPTLGRRRLARRRLCPRARPVQDAAARASGWVPGRTAVSTPLTSSRRWARRARSCRRCCRTHALRWIAALYGIAADIGGAAPDARAAARNARSRPSHPASCRTPVVPLGGAEANLCSLTTLAK